jgi:hypothetical protein
LHVVGISHTYKEILPKALGKNPKFSKKSFIPFIEWRKHETVLKNVQNVLNNNNTGWNCGSCM